MHSMQMKRSTPKRSGRFKTHLIRKASKLTPSSNILLDVSQDNSKNTFSEKMQLVYAACQNDGGMGVTKRSIARIEAFLSDIEKNSAFPTVARSVASKFIATDKKRVVENVQREVERLLDQLYASVDGMLDNKIVDDEEAAARSEMQELLPELLLDWEQASQDLQAVKAKYEDAQ